MLLLAVIMTTACSNDKMNEIDKEVFRSFNQWAKENIEEKCVIDSIKYDTAGSALTYIKVARAMATDELFPELAKTPDVTAKYITGLQNMNKYDTSNVIIATVRTHINNHPKTFFIGMRDKSVVTTPKQHGHEAINEVHHAGEKLLYESCHLLWSNTRIIVEAGASANAERNFNPALVGSDDDFYVFWMGLCEYAKNTSLTYIP